MAAERTETMIAKENLPEAEEVMEFLSTLNQDGKKEFSAFIKGAKFMAGVFTDGAKTA